MMTWLRTRIGGEDPAVKSEAEEMLQAYGSEAYGISYNLARDKRNKGDTEQARHWAKVTAYIASQKSRPEARLQV